MPAWDKREGDEHADGIQRNQGVRVAVEEDKRKQAKIPKMMMPLENTRRSPNVRHLMGHIAVARQNRSEMGEAGKGAVGGKDQQQHRPKLGARSRETRSPKVRRAN